MHDKYSIVSGESTSVRGATIELVNEVNELMRHGWQPLGAPIYGGTETHRGFTKHVFYQAVIKHGFSLESDT